jgi:hypothetical protein
LANATSLQSAAYQSVRDVGAAYSEVAVELANATAAATAAKAAFTTAQAAKDATDRKAKEAERAKAALAYTRAVEDRDLALEILDEFKGGFDSWDENTEMNLNPDQMADYEGMQAAFAAADTAYNLAAVQQQAENAAEVAKAKAAARLALEEERKVQEVARGEAVLALKEQESALYEEQAEFDVSVTNLKDAINYVEDADEKKEMFAELAEKMLARDG